MATKWTVEITVNDTWVEDGFDLGSDEAQQDLGEKLIGFAYSWEVSCKTIKTEKVPDLES